MTSDFPRNFNNYELQIIFGAFVALQSLFRGDALAPGALQFSDVMLVILERERRRRGLPDANFDVEKLRQKANEAAKQYFPATKREVN